MKRPLKPRIEKPRLVWKWSARLQAWEPYHRVTWTEGSRRRQKAILLKWEGDAQTLDALYWQCEAGRHERQKPEVKHTWGDLIRAWRSDPRIQGRLSAGTKKSYSRDMEEILIKNANKAVRNTGKQNLRSIHAKMAGKPRKADKRLQVISLLWNYAKDKLDWPIGDNPTKGIDHYGKQREFEPWPDWMIGKLSEAPDTVRTAAELILGTGQRPNAAISMEHRRFSGDWMEVLDEKGGEYFETYCPKDLRDYLSSRELKGKHVLAKNLTEPLGYDAVEKSFRRWRNNLGEAAKPYVLHGLRKLAIIRLAEAGCTDAEIQAVTNQSPEMVAYYRKKASRKALSKAAQHRRT